MSDLSTSAIATARQSYAIYSRFIRPNDVGATGAHQSGFYIQKQFSNELFDVECIKGSNLTIPIHIEWQDGSITKSNFKYYGNGTRNEARITGFGKGFEFIGYEYSGSLLILCRISNTDLLFKGFVLSSDEDIDEFIAATGIQAGTLLLHSEHYQSHITDTIEELYKQYPHFPNTQQMAELSRINLPFNSDKASNTLLNWIKKEYELFILFENREFEKMKPQIKDINNFIRIANSFLNRRKSRAGSSLELHLEEIFKKLSLSFDRQARTEGKKKPDFLFPGESAYHAKDENGIFIFDCSQLTMLGAKTTCKDRWRQVLNEADRIPHKHLFTLQEGISDDQIREMTSHDLTLVVPKKSKESFGAFGKTKVITLEEFTQHICLQQFA